MGNRTILDTQVSWSTQTLIISYNPIIVNYGTICLVFQVSAWVILKLKKYQYNLIFELKYK